MKAIINGRIVTQNTVIENGTVLFDEKIRAVGTDIDIKSAEVIDAEGNYVIPGLVDIHIHGYCGDDVCDADCDGIRRISMALTRNGVTAWCPTTMTVARENIEEAFSVVRELKGDTTGAKILGVNVEGPYINPSKKGAQAEEHIKKPDAQFIIDNKDIIKLVTVAPETDGGLEFIDRVTKESDICVSIGHTAADYLCTKSAIRKGARHITHLFNAMPPLNHREPGVIGAALENDEVSCEIIADTFHINPALFTILNRVKRDKLILITDCMRAGGMPDGEYTLGGQPVTVNGIECRLSDGTIAGSILTLNKAVRNFKEYTDIPIYEAVNMVSLYPARVVGEDDKIGSITEGKLADIVIADDELEIKSVFINGKRV